MPARDIILQFQHIITYNRFIMGDLSFILSYYFLQTAISHNKMFQLLNIV